MSLFYRIVQRTFRLATHTQRPDPMKHVKKLLLILVVVAAGIAFAQKAQEDTRKPAAQGAKKTECCSKMKTKAGGKMSCCSPDSTCVKDAKTTGGKH